MSRVGPGGDIAADDGALTTDGAIRELETAPSLTSGARAATPGRLLAGRYRVDGLIDTGGMARVYRGTDEVLDRPVAIKLLKPELAANEGFVRRFQREASYGAAVDHPGVATVFDAGVEDGQHFIVMEFVSGRTLQELLREQTVLSPEYAMKIAIRVCAALDEAHQRGLVHGDIKPANLVLTAAGHLRVIDFGSAMAAGPSPISDPVLGTLAYCAPEQAAGEQMDARSDIYSLGVVLHRMLTGELPREVAGASSAGGMLAEPEAAQPDHEVAAIPVPVHAVIQRAMAPRPDDRQQSAQELSNALRGALNGSPGRALTGAADLEEARGGGHTKQLPTPAHRGDEGAARRRAPAAPLSWRLAAINTLVAAAALMVVVAITLQVTRAQLHSELERRVDAVAQSFERGPARSLAQSDELADESRRWLAAQASPGDQVVAVRAGRGEVLTTTGGLSLKQVPDADALLSATESRWWELGGERSSFLARTVPLEAAGRHVGTLVVVAEQTQSTRTWSNLFLTVGGASLVGLLFAAVVTLTTVRRTLRPMSRLARGVDAVNGGDLSWRAVEDGPHDEVGRLAAAFNRMLTRLEQTVGAQRRFVSDASHELRTPLTIAKGQLDLLSPALDQDEERQSLALADAELDRMGRIVQELLLLARLDEGLPLASEPVEVELVLQEALLRGLQVGLRESNVEVSPDLQVFADRDRLLQVLSNLVTNAVQHAGEDARIQLWAGVREKMVAIEVSDDGKGIPSDELPCVFDRFYRSQMSQTESGNSGSGLGLAIAASIVRAMGGEITVTSEPGYGTTFTLLLPDAAIGRLGARGSA
ncbi:protein kinase domain-containing protein [Streptomyces albidus (ex Kaewkla and Franco 2022)]|uniref:protein kinase domain-containing protein n=1 Tax=Streptomyces albidus (ex Kaewkla and Franco 2022) TaxID=722709 RepID=UPI0015EF5490|nr:ATP-binding protein [Streptomyces albidus (ex Kaewkla and Franco 2022)]